MFRIKINYNTVLWGLLESLYTDKRKGGWSSEKWFDDLWQYEHGTGGLEGIHINVGNQFDDWHFMHTRTMRNLNNAFYRLLQGKTKTMAHIVPGLGSNPFDHLVFERKEHAILISTQGKKFHTALNQEVCNWVQATEEVVQANKIYRLVYEQAARIIAPGMTQKFMDFVFPPYQSKQEFEERAKGWMFEPPSNYDPKKEAEFIYIDEEDENVASEKALLCRSNKDKNYVPVTNNYQWQPLEAEWKNYLVNHPKTHEKLEQIMLKFSEKDLNEYRILNNREPYEGYAPF